MGGSTSPGKTPASVLSGGGGVSLGGGIVGGGGGGGSVGPTGTGVFPQVPQFPCLQQYLRLGVHISKWYSCTGNNVPYIFVNMVWVPFPQAAIFTGLHSARLALNVATYTDGTLFYETDRRVYYIVLGGAWIYTSGIMRGTLSPDTKPNDLSCGRYWIPVLFHGLLSYLCLECVTGSAIPGCRWVSTNCRGTWCPSPRRSMATL